MPSLRLMLPCCVALLLVGCESTSSSGSGGGTSSAIREGARHETGGGLNELLARNRGAHVAKLERQNKIARGADDLPAGWKEKIEVWWGAWVRAPKDIDPSLASWSDPDKLHAARVELRRDWVKARTEWVGLGPGAVNILVENLLTWYVRAYDFNAGYEAERAKHELGLFKDETMPYVIQALTLTTTMSGKERNVADSVVRVRLGELLASYGDVPVPSIEKAWTKSTDVGRLALVKALKQMRSPASVPMLQRVAAEDDNDWKLRIEALGAMGRMEARTTSPTFRRCLADDDMSVRKFAAMHMHAVTDGGPDDKEALVDAMEVALREGNRPVAQACRNSLIIMTNKRVPLDPVRWRSTIRQGK